MPAQLIEKIYRHLNRLKPGCKIEYKTLEDVNNSTIVKFTAIEKRGNRNVSASALLLMPLKEQSEEETAKRIAIRLEREIERK